MPPKGNIDVMAIRRSYGMSKADLARALSCAPLTITRWESGENAPTGIYREIFQAMKAAIPLTKKESRHAHGAALTLLGIGGFIYTVVICQPIKPFTS